MSADGDRAFSALVVGLVAALAWNVMRESAPAARPAPQPAPRSAPVPLDSRVVAVADAIAAAEGYYAPGVHGGHSLPFHLNNPGALKKGTVSRADLPTWGESGLLVFPTKEMGWTALRYHVCTMLTGASRMYSPSDTLRFAGLKYTGGDERWGVNVAARLGVPADSRLADLLAGTIWGTPCTAP